MIPFVDTNILLDVFLPDPLWGATSKQALEAAYEQGSLLINEIIYAELSPQFPTKEILDSTLNTLGIQIASLTIHVAYQAASKWKQYREPGGKRTRILSDSLIGAHAEAQAERLLTLDRGL